MSSIKPVKDTDAFPASDTNDPIQAARERLAQDIALLVLRVHRQKATPAQRSDQKSIDEKR